MSFRCSGSWRRDHRARSQEVDEVVPATLPGEQRRAENRRKPQRTDRVCFGGVGTVEHELAAEVAV
jgi:hypothetical protein